ncbi:MAG TPA: PIN domain-containing protein [Candidatus Acidoferrum sp.]|nr:PIN domain-containing protein [Candidatus Acidoferrum sp.]
MNARFFLDTNIFVYSFEQSSPQKSDRASELIRHAIRSRNGIVSYQVVQEFFNVAFRRFVRPMSAADAEQYLAATFRPLMAVNSSPALFVEAFRLSSGHSLSWYDAIIVAAAIEGEAGILYSEDFQHGQEFESLRIENPFR